MFLIVKHNIGSGVEAEAEESISTDAQLLSELNQQKESLEEKIQTAAQMIASMRERKRQEEIETSKRESAQNELEKLTNQIRQEETRKKSLENQVIAMQPVQSDDVVEDLQVGEEKYLLGMKVEGRRIVILLDRSASMTDRLLIDVITRKIKSDPEKQAGPKWQRAKRTARWLLNRLPEQSRFAVVAYNKTAKILNNGQWADSRSATDVRTVFDEIESLVPTGATNLEAALLSLNKLSPRPTNAYIVSDGLPTVSSKAQGLFSKCGRGKNTVSGACRRQILDRSFASGLSNNRDLTVNVILLPLEGDPEAAPGYWGWAAVTGGLLLVPEVGWP